MAAAVGTMAAVGTAAALAAAVGTAAEVGTPAVQSISVAVYVVELFSTPMALQAIIPISAILGVLLLVRVTA